MKYSTITKLLACGGLLLAGFMAALNSLSPVPTFEKHEERVTRYYHNNPNPEDSEKALAKAATVLLAVYTVVLGGLGFPAYQFFNILIYLVLWPAFMVVLTYWALGPTDKRLG